MYSLSWLLVIIACILSVVVCDCPNGCSSRGLCVNNACVCAEGLTGSDCSTKASTSLPTLYECPSCYQFTVGPARYYTGPSWRIPDGPIVALNYKGTLSMMQGNGNGELIAQGLVEVLKTGTAGNFDSCGSWIMRALTLDSGKVAGFYHAETAYTGVARAWRSSGGYPGSFTKYYNGAWSTPGVGGNSTGLKNMPGPQVYLHTPSNSFVSVGNFNPYWNQGFMMSTSDNAIDWKYMGDPITTPDPMTNNDQFMYPSFMGPTGGYDVGNKFQFFYMWIAPGSTWTYRYQISKEISITYVGKNSTAPSTKVALTSFISTVTGETWQSTEIALPPYKATNIVGYLMTRPYPSSFVVYDCLNYTNGDHFVGTADECFLSGAGIVVTRTLGYIWATRQNQSVAVYRCYAQNQKDLFLSSDSNCEGRASAQTVPFGYMMTGPALTNSAALDVLIPQGTTWKFYNKSAPTSTWNQRYFDDSTWLVAQSPFGAGYSADLVKTPFGARDYYFRTTFTIPTGSTVKKMLLSVASDNYAIVYINGVLVDADPSTWHEAAYWNRRIYINTTMLTTGANVIAVVTKNMDNWAFFDLELSAKYYDVAAAAEAVCTPGCGSNGQCISGKCVCDNGWSGSDCNTNLCAYSDSTTQIVVPAGSSFRHTQWSYVGSTPSGWFASSFDDSWWQINNAPFATSYYSDRVTTIGGVRHLYRKKVLIEVPYGKTIMSATLSIASDDTHRVYLNGKFVGSPIFPYQGHYSQRWNDVITIPGSVLNEGVNTIAIEVPLADGRWTAYFDMQWAVSFATRSCAAPPTTPYVPSTPSPTLTPVSTTKPTSAPTTVPSAAPTTRPTSAPTSAPATPAPTTKPTSAPATPAPTTKPTSAPATPAPTTKPTAAPTTAPAVSVKLNLYQGAGAWWFAASASGSRASEVTKMEIKDSGLLNSYKVMPLGWGDVYTYSPAGNALVLPLTIRASLPSGSSITFSVNSFTSSAIDSGIQFP